MANKKITKKAKFIKAYNGNAEETARKLKMSVGYARNLMMKSDVLKAIKARETKKEQPLIWDREQRQIFWTNMAQNAERDSDRLKASELLGKSNCDFSEKLVHEGGDKPVKVNLVLGDKNL